MIKLRRTVFFLLLGVTAFGCQSVPKANDAAQPKSFCQISANYEGKIDSLVALMTLDEKVNMLHGTGMFWSGGVKAELRSALSVSMTAMTLFGSMV